ncbi:hypothetical protein ACK4CJ_12910 [Enterococcus gallinarum]|uniref:hypothetical protein n=1 Tax=Enterococcus gallinarum TaxID=1353 RepID=UPI00391BCCBE
MSGAYEDQLAKEERMEAGMRGKGYVKCDNCGAMFKPSKNDPEQFVCDDCYKHAIEKD